MLKLWPQHLLCKGNAGLHLSEFGGESSVTLNGSHSVLNDKGQGCIAGTSPSTAPVDRTHVSIRTEITASEELIPSYC